jgi:hypothetical protein
VLSTVVAVVCVVVLIVVFDAAVIVVIVICLICARETIGALLALLVDIIHVLAPRSVTRAVVAIIIDKHEP